MIAPWQEFGQVLGQSFVYYELIIKFMRVTVYGQTFQGFVTTLATLFDQALAVFCITGPDDKVGSEVLPDMALHIAHLFSKFAS